MASRSSSSSSVSSFSSYSGQCKYDVFLSFRGHNDFTSHLYHVLRKKKIKTFMDDKLEKGKDMHTLFHDIEESAISIIIFSDDFVGSALCLDEVAKIVDCMKTLGQMVLPVFLDVDSYDVGEKEKAFMTVIDEHEKKAKVERDEEVMEKIPIWREALSACFSQCGWDSNFTRLDSKLVEQIVKYVVDTRRKMSGSCSRHLIGINSRIQKVMSLLHVGSSDTRVVGIWGMGGIGKTTIARTIYNRISRTFDVCYFVENVSFRVKKSGLDNLVRQLYARILDEDAGSLELGNNLVKSRLRCKKVLIVLDNVEDCLQVEKLLLGDHESFGLGSKVIIASRDLQVINKTADETYNVETLDYNESLQLFSLYAFKQNDPQTDHIEQLKALLDYCQSNPLAIKVLGSNLYFKKEHEWENVLDGLKKDPKPEIYNVLKACYDGLDAEEKKIFLDIACFFRGWDRDIVLEILESCYSSAYAKLDNIIDKSLIAISDNDIDVHDLLQELGWDIVLEESKPEKRSRLWDPEDIYNVLINKKGTRAIEGIFLDSCSARDMHFESDAFMGMVNLKILKIYGCDNVVDISPALTVKNNKINSQSRCHLSFLSNELRYLYWSGFPFKSLPRRFTAEDLVMLILPNSMVKQLWAGVLHLPKLKRINLERSKFLNEIPNLSKAENVTHINLARCESLVQLHPSLQHLKKLEHLNLHGCTKLRNLPEKIDSLFLRYFDLSYCQHVEKCPDVYGNMEELYLAGTTITELPQSIVKVQLLRVLKLANCSRLTKLPELPSGIEELNFFNAAIRELPHSFHELKLLRVLNLSGCSNLSKLPELPHGIFELYLSDTAIKELPQSIHELKSLRILNLKGCSNIAKLPELPPCLQELHLSGTAIEELPSSIQFLTKLVYLRLEHCKKLSKIPGSLTKLKSLKDLSFQDCPRIERFPKILEPMECLNDLNLDSCENLESLPSSISRLKSLRTLKIHKCQKLGSFPEIWEPMEGLTFLRISCCNNIKSLPNIMHHFKYLERLELEEMAIQELPSSVEQLQFLKHLMLENCENLVSLPKDIRKLFNCIEISIKGCTKLYSLPELPPYLKRFEAFNCESLTTLTNSWGRSLTRMSFQSCFQLDENACSFIRDSIRRQIQFMVVKLPQHRRPIQRILPGNDIPEWINNESEGSSATIKIPLNMDNIKGIAFCIVYSLKDPSSIAQTEYWIEKIMCKCRIKDGNNRGGSNKVIFRWETPFEVHVGKLDQVVLCYEPCIEALLGDMVKESFIRSYDNIEVICEFYPVDSGGQCNVKKCAVHLVQHDAEFWNHVLQNQAESLTQDS